MNAIQEIQIAHDAVTLHALLVHQDHQNLAKETNVPIVRVLIDRDLIVQEAIDHNVTANSNRAHREVAADLELTKLLSLEMNVLEIAL